MAAAVSKTNSDASVPTAGVNGSKLRLGLAAVILFAMAVRLVSLSFAPTYAYLPDHLDYMGWSGYIHQNGLTSAYSMPAGLPVPYHMVDAAGKARPMMAKTPHAFNYPPLGAYVFWAQGALWRAIDTPAPAAGGAPSQPPAMALPFANTITARAVNALPNVICDFVLAFGVAGMVWRLRGRPRRGWIELAALTLTLLAPPLFLDSSFWNQADSWIGCLLVWTLNGLLDGRFLFAGLVYGLALVTKPQAILLGPVLGFAFLAHWLMPGQRSAALRGLLMLVSAAAAVVGVVALPFMLADARIADGPFRWFRNSYQETLTTQAYQRVTLNAFNLWMLDSVARPAPRSMDEISDQVLLVGIRKSVVGKSLLAAAVLVVFGLCLRQRNVGAEVGIVCAFLVTFAAFFLPTGVHERYIYYCIPFAIALAFIRRRWILPLALLLIIGTFEMVSFRFVQVNNPASRSQVAVLSILALIAFVWSFVAASMPLNSRNTKH